MLQRVKRASKLHVTPRTGVVSLIAACYMLGTLAAFIAFPPLRPVFSEALLGNPSPTSPRILSASTKSSPAASPVPLSVRAPVTSVSVASGPAGPVGNDKVGIAAGSSLGDLNSAQLNAVLAGIKALGVGWVRFDVQWDQVQAAGPNSFDWSAYDRIAAAVRSHGLAAIAVIDYTPSWAAVSGCSSFACEPANVGAYAAFAADVARRYDSYGMHTYEIWNEPNNAQFFQPAPDPGYYTAMLKAAYVAIKSIDRGDTVLTGGLAPAGDPVTPPEFLTNMYNSGAAGYFTAVADHPYTFPVTATYPNPYDTWGQMIQMHAVMAAHGQGNVPIWITEYGAPTGGPGPVATANNYAVPADHVTEALQAQMVTDFFQASKSLPWLGPILWYSYLDAGTTNDTNENFFGLVRADGSHKPAYDVFVQQVRNY